MSTILDALRKAEQERDLGKVPDLRSFHTVPTTPRSHGWLVASLAVLLVNATLLSWFLGRDAPPEAPDSLPTSPATTPGLVDSATPLPSTPKPPVTTPSAPGAPPRAQLAPAPPAPAQDSVMPVVTDLAGPEPTRPPDPDLLSLPPEALLAMRDVPTPQPLSAMPDSFQRALPALNLDVHVYSDDAARRFVLINGRRYREGDWIQEGPLVEAIAPDGVIMSHQQHRFVIPIER